MSRNFSCESRYSFIRIEIRKLTNWTTELTTTYVCLQMWKDIEDFFYENGQNDVSLTGSPTVSSKTPCLPNEVPSNAPIDLEQLLSDTLCQIPSQTFESHLLPPVAESTRFVHSPHTSLMSSSPCPVEKRAGQASYAISVVKNNLTFSHTVVQTI